MPGSIDGIGLQDYPLCCTDSGWLQTRRVLLLRWRRSLAGGQQACIRPSPSFHHSIIPSWHMFPRPSVSRSPCQCAPCRRQLLALPLPATVLYRKEAAAVDAAAGRGKDGEGRWQANLRLRRKEANITACSCPQTGYDSLDHADVATAPCRHRTRVTE